MAEAERGGVWGELGEPRACGGALGWDQSLWLGQGSLSAGRSLGSSVAGCSTRTAADGLSGVRAGGPAGSEEQRGAANAPLLFAAAEEPEVHREIPEPTLFHAAAITGVALVFLAEKAACPLPNLPLRLPAGEGAGRSPAPPARRLNGELCVPSTALPYLICTPARSDAQWGGLSTEAGQTMLGSARR